MSVGGCLAFSVNAFCVSEHILLFVDLCVLFFRNPPSAVAKFRNIHQHMHFICLGMHFERF